MANSNKIVIDLNDLTDEILERGFLTDDKLKGECDYKQWEFSRDMHTDARYFRDKKSGIEMYCSPCFESDWGTIYFQANNVYGDNGFGECVDVVELDIKPYFGDLEKQKELWRSTAEKVMDQLEQMPNYADIVAENMVTEKVHEMFDDVEYNNTYKNDKATFDRIDYLKECLITEFKKVKNKK
jgi:Asp-tRNA(Asn)/Glu-tRNA(Gln) amidotransferase C subunit